MSSIIITKLRTVSPYTKGNMNCPRLLMVKNNIKEMIMWKFVLIKLIII